MNDLRLPPQNIELEESILCLCLTEPEDTVFDILSPADFYRTSHQKIFTICFNLYRKQEPIDLNNVITELRNLQQLEEVGGASYLSKLLDSLPPIDAEYSANKIKSYSQLRQMIELSNTITKKCFNGQIQDVENIIGFAQSEILKIGLDNQNKIRKLNDIVMDCIDHCETIAQTCGITGVPSGFADLDLLTCGWQSGDLILIAARPGMGKTAFAGSCLLHAGHNGFAGLFCSLEMASLQIGNRFLASESRIDSLKFRSGRFSMEDWQKLTDAAGRISNLPIFIDDSPYSTYQDIAKKARFSVKNNGIKSLWIDYLGFLDGDKAEGRVMEVQSISRALKATAKELNIPVVLICQLSRKCEERANKRPILSDLRDSGALEQDADVVLFIYRDEVYNKKFDNPNKGIAEIEIAKQRNGPTGVIKLAWLERFTRFENLANE